MGHGKMKVGKLFALAAGLLLLGCAAPQTRTSVGPEAWRQGVLEQTKSLALRSASTPVPQLPTWTANVRLYLAGDILAQSVGKGFTRDAAIAAASHELLTPDRQRPARSALETGRLLVDLTGPDGNTRLLEFQGKALEMAGDVLAVRSVTDADIRAAIHEQKEYLLRSYDHTYSAFFKLYDARNDVPEDRLRTIYTASGLWTLLLMNDFEPDPRIQALVGPMTDYLLSMQVKEGEFKGAFYYSYYSKTKQLQKRFVVGTASKTIFTLLDLHRRTGDARFLESATAAGHWLVTRVGKQGWVYPVVVWSEEKQRYWQVQDQSVLYSSQTLSALSRLAAVTGEPAFLDAAKRIAQRALRRAKKSDFFVGDQFRPPNTISTSWTAMSFLDYYAASKDARFSKGAFAAGQQVLNRLMRDPSVLADYGRYSDTRTSSGNGWMNEVLVEVYRQCLALKRNDCAGYEEAMRLTTRWLLQNIYTLENSYQIPNPPRARGGSIRGAVSGYGKTVSQSGDAVQVSVRTDAVCHGGNSLIGVMQMMADQAESSVPETVH